MTTPAIGFIGFGEAGSTIAGGLHAAGVERLCAFDIHTHSPELGPTIRKRAQDAHTTLVDSSRELAASSDLLFSTVTSNAARDAAAQIGPFLQNRHIYADLNSVSPALKQEIETVITGSGARFVEAAVMAPVRPYGHQVPMLLGGAAAPDFAAMLAGYGMRFEVISSTVGTASAVKMCRSIVVKGLEALLLECVLGASRYDADDRVFASLNESFPGLDWKQLADYMINRVVVHGERRAREMEEVAETLRAIGIEPIMADAAARRQGWCAEQGLRARFGADGPATYRDVLEAMGRRTDRPEARASNPS